ncbi:hypothetical protein [Morganella morganii]|uniref:hypothetical protein n=1 Tax=Morganella morganii TaxID=582 RepID=UPI0013B3B68E|nr:hypothetical protein [Morganella morganii]
MNKPAHPTKLIICEWFYLWRKKHRTCCPFGKNDSLTVFGTNRSVTRLPPASAIRTGGRR